MAYTTINKSTDYFETKLYTGNGSTQSITGLDFQPDFVWIKERTDGSSHALTDAVRGNTKYLATNGNDVEDTITDRVTSFNSDGFSLGGNVAVNQNTILNLAHNWKAGGSGSANTDGSINSTVSVNNTAGFSIVTWTGNGTSGSTVGHGLSKKPDMYITKARDYAYSWGVYHKEIDDDKGLLLDTSDSVLTGTGFRNSTAPTNSLIYLGGGSQAYRYTANKSGNTYVAYCFNNIDGYQRAGKYVGNGSTDGAFIYTGFKPALVMIKRIDGANNWLMFDNKRNEFNALDKLLYANLSSSEATQENLDFTSSGFKCRGSGAKINTSGGSYIFLAFAESPFVNSNGVPTNAR